jgi:hypothetical protein
MSANIAKEVAALGRLTVKDLRAKHIEVFGEATRSGNKDWLRKQIAWRIQANASGDLSERARRRPYKGREVVVRVLPRGFEYEGGRSRERLREGLLPRGEDRQGRASDGEGPARDRAGDPPTPPSRTQSTRRPTRSPRSTSARRRRSATRRLPFPTASARPQGVAFPHLPGPPGGRQARPSRTLTGPLFGRTQGPPRKRLTTTCHVAYYIALHVPSASTASGFEVMP